MPPGGKCVVGTSRWLLGTSQAVIRLSESVGRCFLLLSFTDVMIMCSFRRHTQKKSHEVDLVAANQFTRSCFKVRNVQLTSLFMVLAAGTYRRITGEFTSSHLDNSHSDQAYLSLTGQICQDYLSFHELINGRNNEQCRTVSVRYFIISHLFIRFFTCFCLHTLSGDTLSCTLSPLNCLRISIQHQ